MRKPNPEHIKRLHRLIEVSPYPSLLSMRLVTIGIGFAEIEIAIAKKHKQLIRGCPWRCFGFADRYRRFLGRLFRDPKAGPMVHVR